MNALGYIFSPSGRFRRVDYWGVAIANGIVLFLLMRYVDDLNARLDAIKDLAAQKGALKQSLAPAIGAFVGALSCIWVSICCGVKRFHDFGSSGWNSLWLVVPLVNIYFGLKLGFMGGQKADNKYGPSPYK